MYLSTGNSTWYELNKNLFNLKMSFYFSMIFHTKYFVVKGDREIIVTFVNQIRGAWQTIQRYCVHKAVYSKWFNDNLHHSRIWKDDLPIPVEKPLHSTVSVGYNFFQPLHYFWGLRGHSSKPISLKTHITFVIFKYHQ